MSKIQTILKKFKDKKIAIIGDVMLDRYLIGDVNRINPEAPVPVLKVNEEKYVPGGAANTANNLASLGGQVFIVGVVGKDDAKKLLEGKLKESGINTDGLIIHDKKPTIQKVRVVGQTQQMVRIDYEELDTNDKETEEKILAYLRNIVNKVDVVIISDYAKGMITKNLATSVINLCNENKKPIIVDPKPKNIEFYKEATLVTPNQKEASQITKIENKLHNAVLMGEKLKEMLNSNILITKGEHGSSLIELEGDIAHIPTKAKEVYDVSGAGDTVVATLALAIAAGADLKYAAVLANQAAGIVVGKTGTATTTVKELLSLFEKEETKIKSLDELKETVKELRKRGKKIVWTNGCFDILHMGHIKHLEEARNQGDVLLLGLNTDESVRKIKGPNRPILKEDERAEMLSALNSVDYITFFNEENPIKPIAEFKPDVHVKGGDHDPEDYEQMPEAKIINEYGGKIVIIPLKKEFSSENIINKIIETHKK